MILSSKAVRVGLALVLTLFGLAIFSQQRHGFDTGKLRDVKLAGGWHSRPEESGKGTTENGNIPSDGNEDHDDHQILHEHEEAKPSGSGTASSGSNPENGIDWSRFAYVQYVTNSEYLCNSVMLFETLHRLGSRPDRVMMYPAYMFGGGDGSEAAVPGTRDARLLLRARDRYGVKLVPIQVQARATNDRTSPTPALERGRGIREDVSG